MKLIFLDIDGVLTTPRTDFQFCKSCVDNLLDLVKSCDAKIIICSSWKESTLENTLRLLPVCIREHIIAQTPDVEEGNKGKEVQLYLQRHPSAQALPSDNYIIIDDEPDNYLPHQRSLHMVATNTYEGLTEENVRKAISILKG